MNIPSNIPPHIQDYFIKIIPSDFWSYFEDFEKNHWDLLFKNDGYYEIKNDLIEKNKLEKNVTDLQQLNKWQAIALF